MDGLVDRNQTDSCRFFLPYSLQPRARQRDPRSSCPSLHDSCALEDNPTACILAIVLVGPTPTRVANKVSYKVLRTRCTKQGIPMPFPNCPSYATGKYREVLFSSAQRTSVLIPPSSLTIPMGAEPGALTFLHGEQDSAKLKTPTPSRRNLRRNM